MRKILGTILITLLTAITVQAQTLTSAQVQSDISKVLKETYYNGLTGYEVDVKVMNVPFSELIIPDGKVYYEGVSPKDRYIPRDVKRVNVYVNGMLVKTLNLPVAIQAYKEVLVAKEY